MGAWTLGLLIVLGGTGMSIVGMLAVRRWTNLNSMESHHEVAGYLLSIIGTLCAVLLGLVVVDVQSKYQQAQVMAEGEANAVMDLYHLAKSLPKEQMVPIKKSLLDYVTTVVEREWDGKPVNANAEGSVVPLRQLWDILSTYEPVSNRQQACYSVMLTDLQQLGDSRRFRVVTTRGGVSPILWAVLIVGCISTVLFTYFFGVKNVKTQILMTALVSVCLSLNVLLVALFSNPYRGDLRISPDGFLYDIQTMSHLAAKGL